MSIPGRCGIAPSTGMSLLRRYSSMLGLIAAFCIGDRGAGGFRILLEYLTARERLGLRCSEGDSLAW
jgi:hypothetical protein